MTPTAPPAAPAAPLQQRFALVLLALVSLLYTVGFLCYCYRDDAPRPWDESYFLYLPTAVCSTLHRGDGLLAALHTLWDVGYAKPPLSMFGTLPAMLLFGDGSIAYRADNLVVSQAMMWLAYLLMRRRIAPAFAAVFAAGLVLAPYTMLFARIEFAELYLWASTILYLLILLRCDAFRARGWTLLLGVAFGLGMLCKLSFPLVLGPPTLWVLVAALIREGKAGLRPRIGNALMAGAIGACMFVPFYAKNWGQIKQHFLNQFGWLAKEYTIGDPFTADTFFRYFATWLEWYGDLWIWLGWFAAGLALVCVLVGRGRRVFTGWPVGPLLVGGLVNLVYCYFHPVFDPRFSYGTMLMLQLCTAFVIARGLGGLGLERNWVACILLAPFLCFLVTNSHWPDGERVLDRRWPAVGTARHVLFPPVHGKNLAVQVLALQPVAPGEELWIALGGDHMRFSNDTIRLLMRRRNIAGEVIQLGYFGPEPTMRERFLRARRAVLWGIVIDSGSGRESSWAARYAPEALAMLRANPKTFEQLPWQGTLPDQVEVLLFRRTVEFDDQTLLDPPAKPAEKSPR